MPPPFRLVALFLLLAAACKPVETKQTNRLNYPVPRQADVWEDYHGTKVTDPYRWMEALDSSEVGEWVAASNAVTESYLRKLPLRDHFGGRLTELWNYPS